MEDLSNAIKNIENSTWGHASEDAFIHLFDDLDLNSSRLGNSNAARTKLISKVILYASVGYLSINKIEVATSQAIFNMVFEDYNLVEYLYYYLNYIRDKGVLEKLMEQVLKVIYLLQL